MQNNNKLDEWPTTLFFSHKDVWTLFNVIPFYMTVAFDWNKKKYNWNYLIAKNSKKCEKEGKHVDNFNQKWMVKYA